MSEFHHLTNGNVSPEGKARVYISCCVLDVEQYVKRLADDILGLQNCAIYYTSEEGMPEEQLREGLSEMQLFVVAVTARYLETDNRARVFEYGVALEQHIPILPILMENGLETEFTSVIESLYPESSNVQYLDRCAQDGSAISYTEKLRQKLSSTLFGDKLAERIRAAFDAYIFLSYRKKDRKEAQKLMRLIHQIPWAQDIAIWYDEYLVPGEIWSDSIAEALTKSAMMILAVTPNLTEPDNYVARIEYPSARQLGKLILPTEVMPSNIEELRTMFPSLPPVIDGRDKEALEDALKPILQDIALKETGSPEHRYLIGLAYLGGIDVEKNTELAVRNIKAAADCGFTEAISKLADMYRYGDGVEIDIDKSIQIRTHLIDLQEKSYLESRTLDDGNRVLRSSEKLGLEYEDMGQYNHASVQYFQMMKIARKISHDHNIHEFIADCYLKLGRVARRQKDLEYAYIFSDKARRESMHIMEQTGMLYSKMILGQALIELGDIEVERGKLYEAEILYEKALHISHGMNEMNDDLAKVFAGIVYSRIGGVLERRGDLQKAIKAYNLALHIDYDRYMNDKNSESGRNLMLGYSKLSRIFKKLGQDEMSENLHTQALSLGISIWEKDKSAQSLADFMYAYNGGVDFLSNNEISSEEKKNAIERVQAEYLGSWEIRLDLAERYTSLAMEETQDGDYNFAEALFLKSAKILKTIAEETNYPQLYENLSISYTNLGILAEGRGNSFEKEFWYNKAKEVTDSLSR